MNRNEIEAIWARFTEREEFSNETAAEFANHLRCDEDLLRDVADEQIVNAVLKLEAQSAEQNERFINNCVSKIVAESSHHNTIELTPTHVPELAPVPACEGDTTGLDSELPTIVTLADRPLKYSKALRSDSAMNAGRFWSPGLISILAISTAVVFCLSLAIVLNQSGDSSGLSIKNDGPSEGTLSLGESPQLDEGIPVDSHANEKAFAENDEVKDFVANQEVVETPAELLPVPQIAPRSDANKLVQDVTPQMPENHQIVSTEPILTFANWVHEDVDDEKENEAGTRIGIKEIAVENGRGRIVFDSGAKLYYEAPFKATVRSEKDVELYHGNIVAEVPSRVKQFELGTSERRWLVTNRAEFQVRLKPSGDLEAYVSKGRLQIVPTSETGETDTINLSSRGANQFLANSLENTSVPSVQVAKGRQHFMGQIGLGNRPVQTVSPIELQGMAAGLTQLDKELGNEGALARWLDFADKVRQLRINKEASAAAMESLIKEMVPNMPSFQNLKKLGDGNNNSSSNFQGSLNVNGREQKFNSAEDFERAKQELMNNGVLPRDFGINPNQPGQNANNNADFQGEINVNGRSLKFTSPEQFRLFQKQLKR